MLRKSLYTFAIIMVCLIATIPSVADAQTTFWCEVDFGSPAMCDLWCEGVTLTVRTYDGINVMLDIEDMEPVGYAGSDQIYRYQVWFEPNSSAVGWDVMIDNDLLFPTDVIPDPDPIEVDEWNGLDGYFIWGE